MSTTTGVDPVTVKILAAVARGRAMSDVARDMGLSSSTVRRRLAEVRAAWEVPTNMQAVVLAVRSGYI